jgi:alkylation response protein AidB-like acyl-CoA dehydrogenase
MFGFSLTKEQKMVKASFAEVVRDIVAPNAHDMDESRQIPADYLEKAWELGACVAAVPGEFGGDGMEYSPMLNAVVLEELAAGDMAFAVAAMLPSIFINPVLEMGTDKQKKQYLPGSCGEKYQASTAAVCEPRLDFDAMSLAATAVKKNGSYILNGQKCFVPKAASAPNILVAAQLDGKPQLFIVKAGNPGLVVGQREKNIGLYALDTYEITLKDCQIPAEDRLGQEEGCNYSRFIQKGRAAVAALAAGECRASFEQARDYAKKRVQFGEPIAYRQSVAFMIAEMAYEVDCIRLLAWKAASALEVGRDATRDAYLAKIYAGESAMKVCDYGVQVLGGHGYIRDYPQERRYRNSRGVATWEGLATV